MKIVIAAHSSEHFVEWALLSQL